MNAKKQSKHLKKLRKQLLASDPEMVGCAITEADRRNLGKMSAVIDHDHKHGHSHGFHRHVHSQKEKKAVLNRLSRVVGHIESIKRMVEHDDDCSQILIQLAAVRSAINNTGKVVLKNHIQHCIVEAIEQGDEETIQALNEAVDRFVK